MTSDSGLWLYSLEVYGRPGFADAALALQDKYAMDVNLLLTCLWSASVGENLSPGKLQELEVRCAPWRHDVIEVFRELRRDLKGNEDPEISRIREFAKARELDSEKIQQERIQAVLGTLQGQESVEKAAENLKAYLSIVNQRMNKEIRGLLAKLLVLAFDRVTNTEAEKLLS